jgi:putative long chain acyl-CoA synthase
MLLARVESAAATTISPLRGVFARDDAWLATGDLFRRDSDGDHWLVDHVHALIRTAAGSVPSGPIRDALGDLPAVDLALAFGVPTEAEGVELAVAAVQLREGRRLTPRDLTLALAALPPTERPAVVYVVDEIPVTSHYRPRTAPLRRAGLPSPGGDVWAHHEPSGRYRRLTAAARSRLLRGR